VKDSDYIDLKNLADRLLDNDEVKVKFTHPARIAKTGVLLLYIAYEYLTKEDAVSAFDDFSDFARIAAIDLVTSRSMSLEEATEENKGENG
jgi:hypothetical protein